MNYAVQMQKAIPHSRRIKAINPITDEWEVGEIVGTFHENRIGSDPVTGFKIKFEGEDMIHEIPNYQCDF